MKSTMPELRIQLFFPFSPPPLPLPPPQAIYIPLTHALVHRTQYKESLSEGYWAAMELTDESNLCGGTLLRITSRGSSIIAELLRLADNIPECFYTGADGAASQSGAQQEYGGLLFDFDYFKAPEDYESKVNQTDKLTAVEDTFQQTFQTGEQESVELSLDVQTLRHSPSCPFTNLSLPQFCSGSTPSFPQ